MIRTFLSFLAAFMLVSSPASAQLASSDANANIEVLQSATVVKQSDLDFGTLLVSGAGTVTVVPGTNAVSSTGGVTIMGTDATRAHFIGDRGGLSFVYVEIDQTVTLNQVTGTGGVPMDADLTLAVDNVLWGFRRGSGFVLLVFGPEQNYYVGGTLNVPAGQAAGTYEGTFNITVDNP